MYPDKHLTTQVMTSLREHKIKYNINLSSSNNTRGCYYCVKYKNNVDDEHDENPYDYGINKTDQSVDVYKELQKKYQVLEEIYNKLLENNNKILKLQRNHNPKRQTRSRPQYKNLIQNQKMKSLKRLLKLK